MLTHFGFVVTDVFFVTFTQAFANSLMDPVNFLWTVDCGKGVVYFCIFCIKSSRTMIMRVQKGQPVEFRNKGSGCYFWHKWINSFGKIIKILNCANMQNEITTENTQYPKTQWTCLALSNNCVLFNQTCLNVKGWLAFFLWTMHHVIMPHVICVGVSTFSSLAWHK